MSIKSFDDAHDFFPAAATKPLGLLSTLRLVWQSLSEGLLAQHRYETLRANGVPHPKAAQQAISAVYPGR